MAKKETRRRYREDLSEMPDWMKKKKCPQRDKYLSGKRILPKNITGKEKLADLIDQTFLAYNSARLKEGCQLFAEKMLEPDVTIGMSSVGRADAGRPWLLLRRSADQGGLRGLDRRHGREPVPRPPFRPELPRARRQLQDGRHRAARTTTSSASTTSCSATATA